MNAWDVGQLVLWLVVLFNLLLTVALVRRVSAISAQPAGRPMSPGGLPAGAPAPQFRADTPDGTERGSADFAGRAMLLGFFSPTCDACYEHAPHFATLGATAETAGVTTVGVIDGDAAAATRLLDELPAGLPVLLAPRDRNPMLGEYLIDAYPTYTVVQDGVAVESFGALPEVQKWLSGLTAKAGRR